MSSISPIDSSIYSGMIHGIDAVTVLDRSALTRIEPFKSSESYHEPVDLSNYYSNLAEQDLISQLGENVAKSAQDLDNAMITALQNGMSINDACNIKLAQAAYNANCTMLKSTIELTV